MGAGVFYAPNCYGELKAKGVEFKSAPKEQFYGTECVMSDGCSNWFSMTQPKSHYAFRELSSVTFTGATLKVNCFCVR